MRVLGIDPGSLNLGWALIEIDPSRKIKHISYDFIAAPAKLDFLSRLHFMSREMNGLLHRLQPQVTVIEKIFLGKNVDSAFKLGHIRGVCAVQCQAVGSDIVEYSPRTVKKQITGSGSADKLSVQRFLYSQLGIRNGLSSHDASDALALAFCHILQDSVHRKLKQQECL